MLRPLMLPGSDLRSDQEELKVVWKNGRLIIHGYLGKTNSSCDLAMIPVVVREGVK